MALTKIDDRGLNTPIDLLDNEKIRFGTGNDLELFHDGTNSIIDNTTGELRIQTDGAMRLMSTGLAITDETNSDTIVSAQADGAVTLYWDNSPKFATTTTGVNITDGELRIGDASDGNDALIRLGATGTDVDTHGVIYYDKSSNYLSLVVAGESHGGGGILIANGGNVGINTTSPSNILNVATSSNGKGIDVTSGDTYSDLNFSANRSGAGNHIARIQGQWNGANVASIIFNTGGDATSKDDGEIGFATSNGGSSPTYRLYIKQDGKVGIGTAGPSAKLTILGTAVNDGVVRIQSTAANSYPFLSLQNDARQYQITCHGGDSDAFKIYDATAGTNRFKIDTSGNCHIDDGNLVVANGHGIMFYPHDETTSTPGSDSNLLDDYEEGTFNPTLRGHDGSSWSEVTFDSVIRYGWYTKIGNVCRVWIRFYNFHINSGFDGDLAAVGGLPFSSTNTAYKQNILSICDTNAFAESGVYNIALDYNTNTGITRLISGTGSGYSTFSGSTGRYLTISGSYSVG